MKTNMHTQRLSKRLFSLALAVALLAALFIMPAAANASDLTIKYSQYFGVEYLADGVKLVTDSGGNKLLLVPAGAAAPNGYDDAVLVETPLKRAMFLSTTYVGMITELGDTSLYDTIAAVCTPVEDWTTPQVVEGMKSGAIAYILHDMYTMADIEQIAEIAPDFVFTDAASEGDIKLRAMLDELGIKHASMSEWMEEGEAAYLEWIKFFAAFYNLDEEAARIFDEKMAYMDELIAKVAAIPEIDRPSVAYGSVWSGTVYTQGGGSILAAAIGKAGGKYALSGVPGDGTITITMEEFLDKARSADFIIYGTLPMFLENKAALAASEPLFAEFDAFKNDKIYIFSQGYYMNSAKIVEKYEDQVSLFQPSILPDHELVMYQKLPD